MENFQIPSKGEFLMKYAADFRKIARDALHDNWRVAISTGFVASLIGANIVESGGNYTGNSSSDNLIDLPFPRSAQQFLTLVLAVASVLVILSIVQMVIGGAGKLGYAKFNLNLIDRKPAAFSDLFSQFNRLGTGFCMNFLTGIYIFFWSLLFVIPGIIKSYSYSMTPYILSEHPEMSVNEAITASRNIMQGNKGRLFCLLLSFIGWELLFLLPLLVSIPLAFYGICSITALIIIICFSILLETLLLTPYKEAAQAAFYREVSNANLAYQPSI